MIGTGRYAIKRGHNTQFWIDRFGQLFREKNTFANRSYPFSKILAIELASTLKVFNRPHDTIFLTGSVSFFVFIYQKQVSISKLQPSDVTQTISHSFPILGSVQSASEQRYRSKITTTYFCLFALVRHLKVGLVRCGFSFLSRKFRGEPDYMHFVSSVVYHFPKNSGNSGWNVNGIRLPGSLEWTVIKLVNPLFKEGNTK